MDCAEIFIIASPEDLSGFCHWKCLNSVSRCLFKLLPHSSNVNYQGLSESITVYLPWLIFSFLLHLWCFLSLKSLAHSHKNLPCRQKNWSAGMTHGDAQSLCTENIYHQLSFKQCYNQYNANLKQFWERHVKPRIRNC